MPTHRRLRYRGRRKARYRCGWVTLHRTGFAPVGRQTKFHDITASSLQNERYFVAVTAHSLACLRIGVFVTADAARLATGVGGSPFTGRVSHPLDGKQSFMTSPHRHSPLTSLAWSHHATTPRAVAGGPCALTRWCVARGGGLARCGCLRRSLLIGQLHPYNRGGHEESHPPVHLSHEPDRWDGVRYLRV